MKIYFADGGSTFRDNSRVGYDSCSLTYSLTPFPEGVYQQVCEIDDSFTESEAKYIGTYASIEVVSRGTYLKDAVRQLEQEVLEKKKANKSIW